MKERRSLYQFNRHKVWPMARMEHRQVRTSRHHAARGRRGGVLATTQGPELLMYGSR